MRYILFLIAYLGVMFISLSKQTPISLVDSGKTGEMSYFESSSNTPLAGIENYEGNITVISFNYQIFIKKRSVDQIIARFHNGLKSIEKLSNTSCFFLNKSKSLFLLIHSSLSLLNVFRI